MLPILPDLASVVPQPAGSGSVKVSRNPKDPGLGRGNCSATSTHLYGSHILEPFQSRLMSPSATCPKPYSVSSHRPSLEAASFSAKVLAPPGNAAAIRGQLGYELLKGLHGKLTPPYFMMILGIIKSPFQKHVASSYCCY